MIPKVKNQIWIDLASAFLAYQGKITNVSIRSQLGLLFRAFALEGEEVYNEIYNALQSRSPKHAEGDDLDAVAEDYLEQQPDGNYRKSATKSTVIMRIFGSVGSDAAGIIVQKSKTNLRYEQDEGQDTIIVEQSQATKQVRSALKITADTEVRANLGYIDLNYTAVEPGADYQSSVNTIQEFAASPPEGIDTCTNPEKTIGGTDEETDEELRRRIFLFWDSLARGTGPAIEYGASLVPGVRFASFISNYPTIGVDRLVVADEFGLLSDNLKSQVETQIEEYRGAGRQLEVSYAQICNLFVTSVVFLAEGENIQNVTASYTSAVNEFVNANYTFASKIFPADFNIKTDGIQAFQSIRLVAIYDPIHITGIQVEDFVSQTSPINEEIIEIYYNASSQTLLIDNQYIYIGGGGTFTVNFESPLAISSLTFSVNQNQLPVVDTTDEIKYFFTSSTGFELTKYQLPILKDISLTQRKVLGQ